MKKITGAALAVLFTLSLTSCLKDKGYDDRTTGHDLSGVPKVIELAFPKQVDHTKTIGYDYADKPLEITLFYVRLAAAQPASEDITVTIDTTGGYAKVLAGGGDSLMLSSPNFSDFSHPGLKVVIAKGTVETKVTIKSNAITWDPSSVYGIYAKVTAVDKSGYVISQNFVDYSTFVGAKNDYDGVYEITGTLVDQGNQYFGDYGDPAAPRVYELATVGSNTGLFFDQSWNYPNYVVLNATGGGVNSGVRPRITFDPVTRQIVSVINHANNAALPLYSGQFNDADHSIDIEYGMLNRFRITEHWEYIGER